LCFVREGERERGREVLAKSVILRTAIIFRRLNRHTNLYYNYSPCSSDNWGDEGDSTYILNFCINLSCTIYNLN